MSISLLIQHIQTLIAADTTLNKLNLGLVNYGIPKKLPAIYIDGIVFDDNNRSHYTLNICYVTNDMTIVQLDYAQAILTAIQQSHAIRASQLIPRPEPDKTVNGWIIPCTYYPGRL
jgi:hypothetical protein